MRASLDLVGLFLLSLPITAVVGHPHPEFQTQTLTRFITVTATATATASAAAAATSFSSSTGAATAGDSNSNSNSNSNSGVDIGNTSGSTSSAATTFSSTFPQGNSFLDVSLIPPYGITPNISLNDGTPRCAGVEGKAIPCDCPPDPALFVTSLTSLVNSGQEFPEGNSASDQLTRLQACIVTLQNIYGGPGSGVGCPAVSTTWVALQKELQSQLR